MTTDPNSPTLPAPVAGDATVVPDDLSTPGPDAADLCTRVEPYAPVAPEVLPPIPGYAVEAYLGRGGMGVVYRARHAATGRLVALKLITPVGAHDAVARDRFAREVHALAGLKHPNVVAVYDAGEWVGFPYYAMEYVPGPPVAANLDRFRGYAAADVQLRLK